MEKISKWFDSKKGAWFVFGSLSTLTVVNALDGNALITLIVGGAAVMEYLRCKKLEDCGK